MIFNFEKKILEWINNNATKFFFVFISLVAIFIRYKLCQNIVSNDALGFLLPWYDIIKSRGGMAALSGQVGDYGILYQTIIAFFTYIPFLEPLYAYKILSCIFDFVLAGCCVFISRIVLNTKKYDIYAWTIILLSPIVMFNSSAWAQCDSIYTAFCLLTLIMVLKERYILMCVMYSFALTFKLQAIFLLPILLLIYFCKKKFTCLYFGIVPLGMILLSIGGIIHGRGVLDVFRIYVSQESHYQELSKGYYGLWAFFSNGTNSYRTPGIFLAFGLLGLLIFHWIKSKYDINGKNLIWMAFLSTYLVVLTLPSMHERYGYLYEVLALVLIIIDKKTFWAGIGLQLLAFCMYSIYLVGEVYVVHWLSVFNIGLFIWYLLYFENKVIKKGL